MSVESTNSRSYADLFKLNLDSASIQAEAESARTIVSNEWPSLSQAVAPRRLMLKRPSRSDKAERLLMQADEVYAMSLGNEIDTDIDATQESAARSLRVFLKSLEDTVTYWEDEEQMKCKAYLIIGLEEACMQLIRQNVAQADALMERGEHYLTYRLLSNTPLVFTGDENPTTHETEWMSLETVGSWSDSDSDADAADTSDAGSTCASRRSVKFAADVSEWKPIVADTESLPLLAVCLTPTADLPLLNGFVHFGDVAKSPIHRAVTVPASFAPDVFCGEDNTEELSTCDECINDVCMAGESNTKTCGSRSSAIYFSGSSRRW